MDVHPASSPPPRNNFGNSDPKLRKSRYQSFLLLFNFAWFPRSWPDIFASTVTARLIV